MSDPAVSPPRSARASFVLAVVSLFVPILMIILLPTIATVLALVVENLAVAVALVAVFLAIRTLQLGPAGRTSAIFGLLIAAVSLIYNVPLLIRLY